MKITALLSGRVRTPAWIGADSALSFADPGSTWGYVRGKKYSDPKPRVMRLDISWYNQFSSKRTKGVIFNSTGEERWGGKAISKYTITSQTETSNPNITRHAPHQRQIKIENKWRETTAHKLVLGRKDRGGFLQNSQPCNNLVSNTLVAKGSWPTQLPCNKHIFCHSNSDVNTICANFNSVRCYKAPHCFTSHNTRPLS